MTSLSALIASCRVSREICSAAVAVEADGTLRDVVGALGEDEARRPHGDLHETAGHLLGVMVHEHARAPVGAPRDLDLHRPRPGPASTATSRGGT